MDTEPSAGQIFLLFGGIAGIAMSGAGIISIIAWMVFWVFLNHR